MLRMTKNRVVSEDGIRIAVRCSGFAPGRCCSSVVHSPASVAAENRRFAVTTLHPAWLPAAGYSRWVLLSSFFSFAFIVVHALWFPLYPRFSWRDDPFSAVPSPGGRSGQVAR
jgi:hypothetical protein